MIKIKHRGSFQKTERFLRRAKDFDIIAMLDRYARLGVIALAEATPINTGLAASSWGYKIDREDYGYKITWTNDDIEGGLPVILLIQYGHAVPHGAYVEGMDIINPSIRPIFDQISQNAWKELNS